MLKRRVWDPKEKAYWIADKIHAYGDYAKEAAMILQKQADEIEALKDIVNSTLRVQRIEAKKGDILILELNKKTTEDLSQIMKVFADFFPPDSGVSVLFSLGEESATIKKYILDEIHKTKPLKEGTP